MLPLAELEKIRAGTSFQGGGRGEVRSSVWGTLILRCRFITQEFGIQGRGQGWSYKFRNPQRRDDT